jgi:hypothetical protein
MNYYLAYSFVVVVMGISLIVIVETLLDVQIVVAVVEEEKTWRFVVELIELAS